MKALFYGTPAVAVPYLELLARRAELVAVVTQPDRPAGRGLELRPSPVKAKALELGLAVLQPEKPSEIVARLAGLKPDLAVVVAYGRILKRDALLVPRLGSLNVHFSLLPRYRGAAPVQWSLIRGETKTGVTLFWLDEGMDTGPVFLQREQAIDPEDDARTLMEKLQALGVVLLGEALDEIEAGRLPRREQSGEPSAAPLLRSLDARLEVDRPAIELHNRVRGLALGPKPYLELRAGAGLTRLIVLKTKIGAGPGDEKAPPGAILRVDPGAGFLLKCRTSCLWLLSVQPEGKKPVTAANFLNGLRLGAGDFLPLCL
ncbi:MAG: methionyl-tRNA formyltransferase [Elusimicrobia bacterium]|nr:methionyl-tRNA formyltransferase [Elusimicrobiota bacterium]